MNNNIPSYRSTDPLTSRQKVNKQKLLAVALEIISNAPPTGIIAADIEPIAIQNYGVSQLWKRLSDLERLEKIERNGFARSNQSGRWQTVWRLKAVDKQLTLEKML